ncbi:hypothetical protein HC031_28525 [Planosporangium thailandense]|uniref:Uncharacterized protein n=1 Tax=Planosporangium thailandense TaxID=765197 RepID=A0ABX0Y8A3_9ACTN|nr:hypothetical protein [Planosporangium thailandense]NJC73643.1 hypothetical protein [Planosporangium thailandense]
MARRIELSRDQAEDVLRMLTALSAILHAPPLPERLFRTLAPVIGLDIVRYGNRLGVTYLAGNVDRLRRLLIDALGDDQPA